jgi:hypothetical protein
VTADSKTKTYGGADPALTYQVTTGSLVAGDSFSGSLTASRARMSAATRFQQGTLALSGNYALSLRRCEPVDHGACDYRHRGSEDEDLRGADPALTYQVTTGALVAGDSFKGSLSRVAGETSAATRFNRAVSP